MKLHALTILAATGLALSSCANKCIDTGDYGKTPYEDRTAGEGVAVYGDDCKTSDYRASSRMTRSETTEREPVRRMDPIFREEQRK